MARTLSVLVYLIVFLLLSIQKTNCQEREVNLSSNFHLTDFRGNNQLRVVFYNVENLFDYFNDSLKNDDDYLPYQGKYWSQKRYKLKVHQISQTLIALGGWEPPAIIGLCEIENRYVLNSISNYSILNQASYDIIHKDSPDPRGIDVALLYRPDKLELIDFDFFHIDFPFDKKYKTRDILFVQGKLKNGDTLHLFVNHWPSKFKGEYETAPYRSQTSKTLAHKYDSLQRHYPGINTIMMGDFNDPPNSSSLTYLVDSRALTNLMSSSTYQYGTHSFENNWQMIDQFIVSNQLINQKNTVIIKNKQATIFNDNFLLREGVSGNKRPFRTYQGPAYLGGFSDHLPIYLDIILKNK